MGINPVNPVYLGIGFLIVFWFNGLVLMLAKILIRKVAQFLGLREVYLVGDIQEGIVEPGMGLVLNGKAGVIVEVERARPDSRLVGVSIRGLDKVDFVGLSSIVFDS